MKRQQKTAELLTLKFGIGASWYPLYRLVVAMTFKVTRESSVYIYSASDQWIPADGTK